MSKGDLKIMFGKYNNKLTFAEALEQDPSYCEWALRRYQADIAAEKELKESFKAFGEFRNASAEQVASKVPEQSKEKRKKKASIKIEKE